MAFSGSDRINNNNEDQCCSSYFRPTVKQCFLCFLKAFSPLNSTLNLLTPSIFDRKVSLRDWWLVKAENDFQEKRLAVAGFTSGVQRALRVFHSAPITKRYDICTLETADGVTVIFQSSINKRRTMENGFPSEVFRHFLLGFPPYWEEYAENCFEQAVNSGFDLQNTSNFNRATTEPVRAVADTEDVTLSPSKHEDIKNDEPKQCSVANGALIDNLNASDFDQTMTSGAQVVDLTITNKPKNKKKKENQSKGNRYVLRSGITNFCTGSSSLGDAVSGCVIDEVTCEESSFASPTVGDSSILKQRSNNFEDTIMSSTAQTVAEVNDVTPSMVERGSVNVIPITSGSKKYTRPVWGLSNQKQKPISGRSMQQENKEVMSEVVEHPVGWKLKKSSHSILQQEEARPKEMLKASRRLRNLSESLQNKEQNEQISVKKGGSCMKKARRKIIFDRHASPLTGKSKEKTCILSPESLSLKRSRSGRLLLPTLDFWRNQIPVYDVDRNITGIQEELKLYGGGKSEPQKKQKKKYFI